jgi:H+/Cl- antiporter ClcA
MFCTELPDTVPLNVEVAATVVFQVEFVGVVVVVVVLLLSVTLWLSEVQADELSFACGLPAPPWVLVAVAFCVAFPLLSAVLVSEFASTAPDASIRAIAVASVRLLIALSIPLLVNRYEEK